MKSSESVGAGDSGVDCPASSINTTMTLTIELPDELAARLTAIVHATTYNHQECP
jgi:hypothetical protein